MATEIFKHDGRQVFGSDFGSVVKGVDSDNRTITLIASDESIDRDGDIISAKGWELKNYLKNPIFLWVHQYSIVPLSRCLKIFSTKNPPVWTHKFTPPLANLFSNTKDSDVLSISIAMLRECLLSLFIAYGMLQLYSTNYNHYFWETVFSDVIFRPQGQIKQKGKTYGN